VLGLTHEAHQFDHRRSRATSLFSTRLYCFSVFAAGGDLNHLISTSSLVMTAGPAWAEEALALPVVSQHRIREEQDEEHQQHHRHVDQRRHIDVRFLVFVGRQRFQATPREDGMALERRPSRSSGPAHLVRRRPLALRQAFRDLLQRQAVPELRRTFLPDFPGILALSLTPVYL